jgi:hypothetical protein
VLLHLPTVKAWLRDAVKTVMESLGIQAYAYVPNEPHAPCFYPAEAIIVPQTTMVGSADVDLTCRILTSAAEDADGQLLLDELISMSGDYSIWAALEAARGAPGALALDGACDDIYVRRFDGYRMVPGPNETSFYGANLTVRILGSAA